MCCPLEYGHIMTPALLMRTSIRSSFSLISPAHSRTDFRLDKSHLYTAMSAPGTSFLTSSAAALVFSRFLQMNSDRMQDHGT